MKKYISLLLALAITVCLCPAASAASSMQPSEDLVKVIEEFEGFVATPYEDPVGSGNYYIGYGTGCAADHAEVTQAEAEDILKDALTSYVAQVNSFMTKNSVTLNQHQFDALVSFTYNLGAGWTSGGNRLYTYLKNGVSNYSDVQIVDAMGVWGHQGTTPVEGLVNRRIREAKIFLYGDYSGSNSTNYCWLIADRSGGSMENDIFCYTKGQAYGSLPVITQSGKYFAGWKIDSTGKTLSATAVVSQNLHVTAQWSDTPVMPFKDVSSSDWFYDSVVYCYNNGIMDGTTATTFEPKTNMNRAMLVTVLWRLAGEPAGYTGSFTDVGSGLWYSGSVAWAAANGIVDGYGNGKFGPTDNVTREQMVTILWRFAAKQGKNVGSGAAMGLAGYSDAGQVSDYAYEAFGWAVREGVISGTTSTTLSPKTGATRAQVARVLQNYSAV